MGNASFIEENHEGLKDTKTRRIQFMFSLLRVFALCRPSWFSSRISSERQHGDVRVGEYADLAGDLHRVLDDLGGRLLRVRDQGAGGSSRVGPARADAQDAV